MKKIKLTNSEKNIWLVDSVYKDTSVNTLAGSLVIKDKFNIKIATKTVNEVVRQNAALRTNIAIEAGEPYQVIKEYKEFEVKVIDISSKTKKQIEKLKEDLVNIPIDIYSDSLFEYTLLDRKDGLGEIFLKVHHIVSDAWSISKLGTDLSIIYEGLLNGTYESCERPSYEEYITEEEKYLNSDRYIRDEEFFKEYLKDFTEPVKIKENIKDNITAKRYSKKLDKAVLNEINEYIKENRLSVYNVFLAALFIYMYRITEKENIVIGTPVLNRASAKFKEMQGMFVSTVPVRMKIEENLTFEEVCKDIASNSFNIFKHSRFPYSKIIENYRKENSTSDELYDVMFSYQNARAELANKDRYEILWQFSGYIQDTLEFHVLDLNNTNELNINIDYMTNCFEEIEIEYFLRRIIAIIKDGIKNNKSVSDIDIMDEEERHKILYEFNDTKTDYPKDKTVIELFEEQVEINPDNIALVFEDKTMTYKELNEKANSLANELVKEGVTNGSRVAIELDRSIENIIVIIATLKTGACYVPIDVDFSIERKEYIIQDSSCIVHTILKDGKILIIKLDNVNNKKSILKNDEVCILYTSGSTGNPKGVIITSNNVVRLVRNTNYIEFMNNDRVIQAGATVFDASTFEYWGALLNGSSLYLIKKEDLITPNKLEEYLKKNKITVMLLTTALLNQMVDYNPNIFKYLRVLVSGGETMSPIHVNKILDVFPNINLINAYGPTENGTISTTFKVCEKQNSRVLIGKPISNSSCYIVDSKLRILPMHVYGELCVGGEGVAKGYINNSELTSLKFIDNFYNIERIYRTGDIAKILSDGNIDFIGRSDNQVKIRGFRIELDEIKNVILKYKDINDAIVIVNKSINSNNKKVIAYYTAVNKIDKKELLSFLKEKLPTYMIPSSFNQIEQLPLNQNGKIDRTKLPEPSECIDVKNFVKTDIQKKVAEIINRVINDNITFDVKTSILDYGVDSLSIIKLCIELSNEYDIEIQAKDLLVGKSIEDIEKIIKDSKPKRKYRNSISDNNILLNNQKGIFANYVMNTESLNYNIPFEIKFDRTIDCEKLKNSIEKVVNNIPNIFGHIEVESSNVVQKNDNAKFNIKINEISNEEYDIIKNNFVTPFDLLQGPLFKIKMYKTETNIFVLFDFHHIIFDGTSITMLIQKIKKYYEYGLLEKSIIASRTVYSEDNSNYINAKRYFLNEFNGELPINDLPLDNKRPNERSFVGDNVIININQNLTEKINNYSKNNNITLNSIFLSAFNILLSKYMYSDDIIIGIATLGRKTKEELDAIGMFVKTIPFRTIIDYNKSLNEFIFETQNHIINSLENDIYSYDELVKELKIQRDPLRNPLFDVLYTYQNSNTSNVKLEENIGVINSLPTKSSKFDFTCQIENRDDNIQVNMEYCSSIISKSMATDFTKHYINIIKNIIENDSKMKLKDVDMILPEEKEKIIKVFNNTKTAYPIDETATKIFEKNVLKYPDKIAVVFENQKLTYSELNEKANQIAHKLIEAKIKEGSTIAIMADKSIEFMIGVLGALKANCVYMPMDKNMPDERVKFVLEDSATQFILTTKKYYRDVSDINKLFIDIENKELYNNINKENLDLPQTSDKPAYIIYTSGSTGKPKGNIIIHKGVTRLVLNTNYLFFSEKDVMMVSGSLTFDTTIFEVWGAMLYGMTLHFIAKERIVNPTEFKEYIIKNKITTALIPTPIFNQLVEYDAEMFKYMHQICVGGDSFMAKYSNQVFEKCKSLILTNVYGPAENAVICTANIIDRKYDGNIPIGKVTSNSTCYVVDKCDNLCPPRVPGELYVGGDGLGLGYLNREELTKEKFTTPKCLNEKIYKTGDLTSWNTDGTINFKGRIDFQVKIRGQRIEISEIQNKMLEIKEVKEVVILALDNKLGNKYLVAYYTLNKPFDEKKIEEYLRTYLPVYMIPSRFVLLNEMPLNQNGKIDRKALPIVEEDIKLEKVEPDNDVQKKLLDIYRKVLNNDNIFMTDNFFECGGDSLVAMKLAAEASNQDIPLIYAKIFDYPTPLEMYREIYIKDNYENLQKDIDDYDYNKINELLNKKTSIIIPNKKQDILLTGAAGFLGSHVLDNIISNTDLTVYCLIRRKDNMNPNERLKERLNFFFEKKHDKEFGKRIKVIEGDLTFENLFIDGKDKIKVIDNVGIIINTAAYVKHYGKSQIFESVNINGVNNLIKFSLESNMKLVHISTLSVSGNMLEVGQIEQTKIKVPTPYTEKNLYIGQELDNVYAYSKFIAERNILESILLNNLNAIILRVGNLTGRYSDGTFQPNVEENAFVGRIKSFINLGSVAKKMVEMDMEFTPIDLVSDAVVKLSTNINHQIIYHVYNSNHAKLYKLIDSLGNLNIKIGILEDDEQKKKLNDILKKERSDEIKGILIDINSERDVVYSSNIHIENKETIIELKKLKFSWPIIGEEYINKYFKYLRKIKFI